MSVYELYKPLRNYLRKFPLLESLGVVRAYIQHLQFKQPFPSDIQVLEDLLNERTHKEKMLYAPEWELDILAKEIILNSPEHAEKTLRLWPAFAGAINRIKDLENNIYGAHRELAQSNILIELFRIIHRQFPWQRLPHTNALLRYFKIFGTAEFAPILKERIGIEAAKLYTIGLLFCGNFITNFGFNLPPRIVIPGITLEDVDCFIRHFSTDMPTLKRLIAEKQSYDQDYAYTFNPLRKYPLIQVNLQGKSAVIAPIPTFLFRRFTEGVYYEICGDNRFPDAFGRSFQNYVGDVLVAANRTKNLTILAEQSYHVGKDRKDSIDWILSDATGDLFIECKTKKLRFEAKIGLASTDVLNADLDKMADFVVQTYKTLIDALNGLYKHWHFKENKPLYLMIVTLEEWFTFGDKILPIIDEAVRQKIIEANIDPAIMEKYPCTICATDDFELAAQVMAKTNIQTLMRKKITGESRRWNLYSLLNSVFKDEISQMRDSLFPEEMKRIHPDIKTNGLSN